MTVTAKFHNPSLSRRKEWQHASRLYRDTKQFCIDGWENGDFGKSVTTASIDNDLYRRSRPSASGLDPEAVHCLRGTVTVGLLAKLFE